MNITITADAEDHSAGQNEMKGWMSMTSSAQSQTLLRTVLSLPVEERMELAGQLWDSVEDEWTWDKADPEWRAAWEAEILRRIENVRTGKSQLIDGEVVMQQLRERFSK